QVADLFLSCYECLEILLLRYFTTWSDSCARYKLLRTSGRNCLHLFVIEFFNQLVKVISPEPPEIFTVKHYPALFTVVEQNIRKQLVCKIPSNFDTTYVLVFYLAVIRNF